MKNGRKITADNVIGKLRDDGDFDRLRLGIIKKLKKNEDLHSSISSLVKQSAAINRPGALQMEPKQLFDAIHGEIGKEVMSKVSDELWTIIKSESGMKNEIAGTVQSVYYKLLNPKENCESSSMQRAAAVQREVSCNGTLAPPVHHADELMFDNEPTEPPGFSISNNGDGSNRNQLNDGLDAPIINGPNLRNEVKGKGIYLNDVLASHGCDARQSPAFVVHVEQSACEDGDDDPDVPPGFG